MRSLLTGPLAIEIPWGPNITAIGSLLLTWHGLFTAVAILAGVWLALRLGRVIDYDLDDIYSIALVAVPAGIVGARLLFVIERWDFYGTRPGDIISITEGGISIWGGILGGLLGGALFAWWKGYPLLRGLDIGAAGLLLGQAVGRLGDIVNGEHLAIATDLPWGVIYTSPQSPAFAHSVAVGAVHPATSYELVGDLAILGVMLVLFYGLFRYRPGRVFFVYLIGYATMRFFLTYLRVDSAETLDGLLRVPQLVSVVVVLIGAPLAIWVWRRPPDTPVAPKLPPGRVPIAR
jgi:phosphatidylglycerol:prolipoprotein diacylglycerol transferase